MLLASKQQSPINMKTINNHKQTRQDPHSGEEDKGLQTHHKAFTSQGDLWATRINRDSETRDGAARLFKLQQENTGAIFFPIMVV